MIIDNFVVAAIIVAGVLGLVFHEVNASFKLWLLVSGVPTIGFLTCAAIFLKKELEAHKIYDQFAKADRIHSTEQGSPFYYLVEAANGDVSLLERNPEKVDAFLMNGDVQEVHRSLAENRGLPEETKANLNKIIEAHANACVAEM